MIISLYFVEITRGKPYKRHRNNLCDDTMVIKGGEMIFLLCDA